MLRQRISSNMAKTVLVTGTTGKQGGSVIQQLIAQDRAGGAFEILAVTRNAKSPSAQKLLQRYSPTTKVHLVEGNLDNPAEIFAKATEATGRPIWGVFSVQVPMGGGQSAKTEEKQGKALVDEALKNGVEVFVYSSVDRGGDASFDNPTDIPHFISKHHIEHHLVNRTKESGDKMKWTILRPTAFFENLVPGFIGKVFATCWELALRGKPLQCIAVSDIGFFAAQAFIRPEEYKEKCISLAGEELTYDQFVATFKAKTGQEMPSTYNFIAYIVMWLVKEMGYMFRWFHDVGYGANIEELKKINPQLKDFGTWLETESAWAKK